MDIKLIVDGEDIDMNDFVTKVLFEINNGLIKNLRGVDDWSKIEIHIQK
jgi:hypothetical protein